MLSDIRFPSGKQNLFVVDICEPCDLRFRVTVAFGNVGEPRPIGIIADVDFGEGCPIEVTQHSRVFEFFWENYVAYAVRNESYWAKESEEPDVDSRFYTRTSSAFLDYVRATTFAGDSYPGPLTHWAIDTLNHCIAVVGHQDPQIRELDVNDRVQLLIQKGWIERA